MWALLILSVTAILVMLSMALLGAWVLDRRRRPDGVRGLLPEPDWATLLEGAAFTLPGGIPMRDRAFDKPR